MRKPYTGSAAQARAPTEVAVADSTLERALSWLSPRRAEMTALLRRLVDQNSYTRNPEGVNAVASMVAAELEGAGLAVDRIPGPPFGDHLVFGTGAPGS